MKKLLLFSQLLLVALVSSYNVQARYNDVVKTAEAGSKLYKFQPQALKSTEDALAEKRAKEPVFKPHKYQPQSVRSADSKKTSKRSKNESVVDNGSYEDAKIADYLDAV